MDAVTTLGLQIPSDISLACFDDLDWMRFWKPGITAIAQPLTEMGEAAASLVLARIDGERGEPRHITLRPTLTMRGSIIENACSAALSIAASDAPDPHPFADSLD